MTSKKLPRRTGVSIHKDSNSRLSELLQRRKNVSGLNDKHKSDNLAYILLDVSGSMSNSQKISRAKLGVLEFAQDAYGKRYRVGIISFDSFAQVVFEPNMTNIQDKLSELSCSGSTNMAAAISLAVPLLTGTSGKKAIVLVTDGYPDDKRLTLIEANKGKQKGISFITIGTDDADNDFLKQLATDASLSVAVENRDLNRGIRAAAKLLPKI